MLRYRCLSGFFFVFALTAMSQSAYSQLALVTTTSSSITPLSSSTISTPQRLYAFESNLHQMVTDSWDHVRAIKAFGVFTHATAGIDAVKKPKYFNSLTDWKLWNSRARAHTSFASTQANDKFDDTNDLTADARTHIGHTQDLQLAWDAQDDHFADAPRGLAMHSGRVSVMAGFGDGDRTHTTVKATCTAESATYCAGAELNAPVLAQNIDGGFNNQHWYQSVNLGIGYRFR
jgi:hypothetical protein